MARPPKTFAAFDPEKLGGSRPGLVAAGDVNVSIQFVVDQGGVIYRLMPETWMARHCIGLNYSAIGVENVGGAGGEDNLTQAQIEANIRLIRYLAGKYPTIRYLIGHMEYLDFEGHPLWLERDASYRTEKIDPGERFMASVRKGVADLGLEGPP
jgi:beta-N-acetylhexosaminidase